MKGDPAHPQRVARTHPDRARLNGGQQKTRLRCICFLSCCTVYACTVRVIVMISAACTVVVVVILAQHRRGIGGLHPRRLQRLLQLLDVDAVALVAVEFLEGCEHFWRGLAQTLSQTVRLRLCLLGCFDRHLARVWSGSPVNIQSASENRKSTMQGWQRRVRLGREDDMSISHGLYPVELVHDHTELVDVERPVGVGVVPVR